MLPTGLEYFVAFFGVQLAGGIPVPLYPPARKSQIEDHLRRQAGILRTAGAEVLVTFSEVLTLARLLSAQLPGLHRVVTVAELAVGLPSELRPAAGARGGHRLPPVHLRQHGEPQRGGAHPRQPAGESAGDPPGGGHPAGRRDRELASALPRHGADRLLDGRPLLRRPAGPDVAAGLPRPPLALAVGDPPPPGDAVGGAQLRLRAVHQQDPRRGDRGARPLLLAHGAQRRRAGEPRDAAALHRALRAPRLPAGLVLPRLRPRRELARRGLSAARPAAADRRRRARALPALGVGGARGRGRSRRPALRLLRHASGRSRDPRRRRRGPRGGGAPGGAAGVQGAVRHQRLLPQPRGHGEAGPWRLAGLGGPRLHRRRRGLHHRPGQGHHHPRRPQPLPAGAGSGRGRGAGHPQGVRGGLRQPRSGHRHGAPGGDGRDPGAR